MQWKGEKLVTSVFLGPGSVFLVDRESPSAGTWTPCIVFDESERPTFVGTAVAPLIARRRQATSRSANVEGSVNIGSSTVPQGSTGAEQRCSYDGRENVTIANYDAIISLPHTELIAHAIENLRDRPVTCCNVCGVENSPNEGGNCY